MLANKLRMGKAISNVSGGDTGSSTIAFSHTFTSNVTVSLAYLGGAGGGGADDGDSTDGVAGSPASTIVVSGQTKATANPGTGASSLSGYDGLPGDATNIIGGINTTGGASNGGTYTYSGYQGGSGGYINGGSFKALSGTTITVTLGAGGQGSSGNGTYGGDGTVSISWVPDNDTNLSSVVLLLGNVNHSNASSIFEDQSPYSKVITRGASASYSTTSPPTGMSSSMLFASGDYLTTPADTSLNLPGDFTIRLYFKTSTKTQDTYNRHILSGGSASGSMTICIVSTSGYLGFGDDSVGFYVTGTADVCDGSWHHGEVTRSGTTLRLFIDGTQQGGNQTNSTSWAVATTLTFGKYSTAGRFIGNMAALEIYKGVALHTANFTPPSLPL